MFSTSSRSEEDLRAAIKALEDLLTDNRKKMSDVAGRLASSSSIIVKAPIRSQPDDALEKMNEWREAKDRSDKRVKGLVKNAQDLAKTCQSSVELLESLAEERETLGLQLGQLMVQLDDLLKAKQKAPENVYPLGKTGTYGEK